MKLYLKEKGINTETFTTDNPKIASVKFNYIGKENDLDTFLHNLIIDYAKQNKLIVD